MSPNRRELLRKLGGAGAAVTGISVAGCTGDDGAEDRAVEDDLPEERRVREDLEYLINTERYDPDRYQSVEYITERLGETLGIDISVDATEIGVLVEREENGEYDIVTYNWTTGDGDPHSILMERFHSDGPRNHSGFSHSEFDDLAEQQASETDVDERQSLVFEAQRILGEQRQESQHLYNENVKGYNSDRIDPDSIVVDPLTNGFPSIYNWVSMEPLNEEGQVLVTNNWDPSDQLNPFHHNARGPSRNNNPTSMMHDFLVRTDPNDFSPDPWAAEGWEWLSDTEIVVTLESGMRFHDGEPVTADDVVWTFQTMMETEPPAYIAFVDPIESVEETGDDEVTFVLEEPFAPFLVSSLGEVPILPRHYWENILSETGNEDTPWEVVIDDDRPAIGSGPFQWGQWDQGERFEMPAFEDHPFAAPNIETRVQRPLSTRDAELEALVQGQYDLLDYWFGDLNRLEESVEENDHLTSVVHLDDSRQAAWLNLEREPFDDVAFRQAVNAVMTAANPVIVEEVYGGFGRRAISPINESIEFWHNPDTPVFDGEDVAVELLEDAGYVWDSEGRLYHPE
ncbi:hypothetical protein GRS48_09605 [Halorubrum sp. JWXQ-INN 858]|uniref:ABC transporter substrate-binding protein n=1 Tax=Halorubrum sp. JWXQ-INN 858 TaxID=2690782 RepID=UPI00135703D8|nr:ABC transporter substrate-binding protein [Halorubrum sp. JWXQ-INN 858]MWV65071.1 hypothetical protein [Halorubrum sp. JWXQ-INN 858]